VGLTVDIEAHKQKTKKQNNEKQQQPTNNKKRRITVIAAFIVKLNMHKKLVGTRKMLNVKTSKTVPDVSVDADKSEQLRFPFLLHSTH